MIYFCNIIINEKSKGEDYRAFLSWVDTEANLQYEIRGYGPTPGQAADDAYKKYESEDREFYEVESFVWKK